MCAVFAQDYQPEKVFTVVVKDSTTADVLLWRDKSGRPAYFSSLLQTGVCTDGLCYPVDITIYWDLLGKFSDYKPSEGHPLTKFDHIVFTRNDHARLHEILADGNSLLRDYKPEDMIDTSVKVFSAKVDAVTGATSKTFAESIVPGAVYTVYTLWHFVHDEIPGRIISYIQNHLDDNLIRQFLWGKPDYQIYVLEHLPKDKQALYRQALINLLTDKDTFVPHYALIRLPATIWSDPAGQEAILQKFPGTQRTVQNALLEKFRGQKLSQPALKQLVSYIPQMDKFQLSKVLFILQNNDISGLKKQLTVAADQLPAAVAEQKKQLLHLTKN
ncbi:hypothetical protein FW774_11260 [Pedobacter sp. BS3]|uniref:hypothetical protein n=1 Tax=Pedobacter sp. BS3 TaxID=2567937 RepID=UPI0011EEEFF1|nr:hypothetical protein [Pedobacter sp. BS3]TZF84016.1 hypothetical protein FW774_11260 [Pedobacter sp. BS3]